VDSMPADFKRELDKLINNYSVMTVKKFHNCSAIEEDTATRGPEAPGGLQKPFDRS